MNKYILVSSNDIKLKEFKEFGLTFNIEKGKDLKEVNGTDIEVIIHKAKDAGINRIVEDTSLNIEGSDIGVNIRWLIDELPKFHNKPAIWLVLLGVNTGTEIIVYEGHINGIIKNNQMPHDNFGFDCFFVPTDNNKNQFTLYDLIKLNKKNDFSARKNACLNLINNKYVQKIKLCDIKEWNGEYQ